MSVYIGLLREGRNMWLTGGNCRQPVQHESTVDVPLKPSFLFGYLIETGGYSHWKTPEQARSVLVSATGHVSFTPVESNRLYATGTAVIHIRKRKRRCSVTWLVLHMYCLSVFVLQTCWLIWSWERGGGKAFDTKLMISLVCRLCDAWRKLIAHIV